MIKPDSNRAVLLRSLILILFFTSIIIAVATWQMERLGIVWASIISIVSVILISTKILYWQIISPLVNSLNLISMLVSGTENQQLNAKIDSVTRHPLVGKGFQQTTDLIKVLKNTIGLISASGSQIAIASASISFSAEQLKQQMHKEVQWINDIKQSSEHVRNIVSSSSTGAHAATLSASEMIKASEKGHKAIAESVNHMRITNQQAKDTATRIQSLSEKSDQIQQITSVISSIAEQTNLLALNAAIEAARAGEQGRGFAVVADEVRNLAHKTAEATEEIGEMVCEIGDNIQQAESTMIGLTISIDEGVLGTNAIGERLDIIADCANKMQQHMQEISDGILESQSEVGLISESIASVNTQLKTTEGRVTSVADDADALSKLAENIQQSSMEFDQGSFHSQVNDIAQNTVKRIAEIFERAIENGRISQFELFDQNYLPIEATNPQKYHTKFDKFTDEVLPELQEPIVEKYSAILYAGAVDTNGYFPTHNKIYSQPLTGNYEVDIINNRTKRIFDDPTGSRCGSHTNPFLVQTYKRDTGEVMHDLSAPIMVNGKHWGGFRIGYLAE